MKTIRTTCPYCGVGCGVLASVDDAGQVSVRGDDQHPANLGRLCVKGAALGETTGLAGRLLTPEVDGQQVAWPQALAETAARLRQIIDQHGPQAVAFYASGQLLTEDYYAANKLMKGFIGAANIDTNSRLCMSSAVTGYKRAFGADVVPCSYDDVENSDLVVLVGSNAAWAHPVLFQRLAQAKRDNPRLRIVAIDPRRTATCEIADRHLALAPGSDGGLFAGLLNALAEAGACVDGFRDGPQALAAARGWDVARVAAFCGLPADEVAGFYREFIAAPRAITLYTMGINPPAAATNVTPSSTSIWPAEVWPPRLRPLFADRSTQRHGRPRSRRAGDDAGGAHGFCARRSAAAGPLLGDGTAGADPRADRRGAVCRHWPRRGQSGLDHGYQPGGVAP
ncbi:putative nitrate reductase [Klebsiella pneumoniae]|uniref:Putative nitrate reductase n=1 Tax=Klebsiella pneumoniae TaxID=573 RepID=A0A2X1QBB0_KLEPN|nr:putative nitrate reductase [Klebsiella pneumoniae]